MKMVRKWSEEPNKPESTGVLVCRQERIAQKGGDHWSMQEYNEFGNGGLTDILFKAALVEIGDRLLLAKE